MHDTIYSRDGLDRFVDGWSQQDIRLSFPAWGLKGVLWGVRKILAGMYEGINLLYLSLSRQMEYNADDVAVRMTGSDALIHGLARLQFASHSLADAAKSLDAAADHGLFTLSNIPAGSSLHSLVVDRGDTLSLQLSGHNISGQWLDKLMEAFGRSPHPAEAIHFKSLGGLLACQEALAEEGRLVTANPPGPPTTPVIATNG